MPSRTSEEPTFDLMRYARQGPGRRDRLSLAEVRQIERIVGRAPEVMAKVLPRGANDLAAVRKHLDYIGRKGEHRDRRWTTGPRRRCWGRLTGRLGS